ncbi:MAG TPA: hypothetical protein VG937_37925 [Polyangiaceae bacterium]|nr:hypothetical protein [Polyangiaceae bacterium]
MLFAACAPRAEKAKPGATTMPPAAAVQTGYCERLQPLLDRAVRAARIGSELTCLDVPNITGLGWYGPPGSAEEAALADCFEHGADYESLLHQAEGSFDLSIDQDFREESSSGGGVRLSNLVPWLPEVQASVSSKVRLSARVTIKEARFVTLVGVASRLQGQASEMRCLEGLCKADCSYVQKALIGTPTVTLEMRDEAGKTLAIDAIAASAGFSQRKLSGGAAELSSTKPVTLAVARSAFRTTQTERLCDFCGKRGQKCCAGQTPCDGGLGCIADRCADVGGPGQPCDAGSCSGGATCVSGTCQLECGGRKQPCCPDSQCSGKLKCTPDPDNAIEHKVAGEDVEVSGGLFGTDEDRSFGDASCGPLMTRARFAVTKLGSGRGSCEKAWWFEPKNEKDCRVAVHFDVSPFGSVRCRVNAFALAPRKPDICQ